MRRLSLWVVFVLFGSLLVLQAADRADVKKSDVKRDGDLFLLGISVNQQPAAESWSRVGKENAWGEVLVSAALKKRIYTIENDETLQKTNPITGEKTPIGKADFRDTPFLFAGGNQLYAIRTNGSLFRIDPDAGIRTQVGPEGGWKEVSAGTILGEHLYTVEKDGSLQKTDLTTGQRTPVGKPDFKETSYLFAGGDKLYLVKSNGNLWRVHPGTGAWSQVGSEGAWKAVRAGSVLNSRLYTAETTEVDGTAEPTKLWTTELSTGKRTKFGNKEYLETEHVLVAAGVIYTIENGGNMNKVSMDPSKERDGNSEFNGYPQDLERAFRDQGQDLCRAMHSRLIGGAKTTYQEVMDGLAWLRQSTSKKDLAVLYLIAHGDCSDLSEGWYITDANGEIISSSDFKKELAKIPCQVIFLVESCHSGGFVAHSEPVPPNVTALCSCSHDESCWTEFQVALMEALYGRADFNKNGIVDLDELISYIRLRVAEGVLSYQYDEKGKMAVTKPVLVKAPTMSGSPPLTRVASNIVTVVHNGVMWSALLKKQVDDRFKVRVLGWDSRPSPLFLTNQVTRDNICLPTDGQPLVVRQEDGAWCPARLLGKEGDKFKVLYLPRNEEDVVTKDRVKYPFASNPSR